MPLASSRPGSAPLLRRILAASALVLGLPFAATAQDSVPPAALTGASSASANVRAVRIRLAPRVDGRLDDAAWAEAPAVEGLRQREPNENAPASQRSVVRFVYDDDALYVAAWLYDTAPDSIVARLGRRDNDGNSDAFAVFLDPFHDRRSGYFFGVNAAGVALDGTLSNDGNRDDSWDGVWEGRAGRFEGGWTAELRIPYSQLRFPRAEVQTWGVNVVRVLARRGEDSYIRVAPQSENAFVSYFADLNGIARIRPGRGIELVPYVTARGESSAQAAGNPFNDGTTGAAEVGADFKVALTPNLSLTATVNPDFGQVEADPAEVNLSGFESFLGERRPFFVEGASIFEFGYGGSGRNVGFNWVNNDLFYTRRIGRAPQGRIAGDVQFADRPGTARILGAGKVTGRIGAVNVGVLSATTGRGVAEYRLRGDAETHRAEVEPLTHYGVVRAIREFGGGRQGLGVMGTSANRAFSDDATRAFVNGQAYAGGVDGWAQVLGGRFVVKGWAAASRIEGTAARIADVQRSSVHLLQRPDRRSQRFDATRTSLSGWAGRVAFDQLKGDLILNIALGAVSPTYDLNDVGFLGRSDVINGHIFAGRVWQKPDRFTQYRFLGGAVATSTNFDGVRTGSLLFGRVEQTFRSFWRVNAGVFADLGGLNPSRARGGPLMKSLPGVSMDGNVSTDSRKSWRVGLGTNLYTSENGDNVNLWSDVSWQPSDAVRVSVEPGVSTGRNDGQYVTTRTDALATDTYGARYVFARLNTWELASGLRLNWTFSPTMSLQMFAQPFLSAGRFDDYKELARPRSWDFVRYGVDGASTLTATDEGFTADPDGAAGAAPAFSFGRQDFRYASLRGNAVFRWEYRPGSTLFLVWTQQAEDVESVGEFGIRRPLSRLYDRRPSNAVALKLTYWLGR